jgi:DNA-directed RNA polymerase subunit RPC12/RpoP
MNKIVYFAVFVVSCLALGLAMLFLCVAVNVPERMPLALVLLVVGAVGTGWSGLSYSRWLSLQPGPLGVRITALAEQNSGEVSLAQVVSGLNAPADAAMAAMNDLQQKGQGHMEPRKDTMMFVFPGLKERKMVRKCVYCGNTFPVRDPLQKCPSCGGRLEVVEKT